MTSPADKTNAPQQFATLPRELLDACAAVKGHAPVPDDQVVPMPLDKVYPGAAAVVKTELRREGAKQQEANEAIREQIGKTMDGDIFCGQCNILGRVFNLLAAKQDLTDASGNANLKYTAAKDLAAGMVTFNGHDVIDYADPRALLTALNNSEYGNWFIPPRELVAGTDSEGKPANGDSLYSCANAGKLPGVSQNAKYGSTTEWNDKPEFVTATQLPGGVVSPEPKSLSRLRYRLVRLIPA